MARKKPARPTSKKAQKKATKKAAPKSAARKAVKKAVKKGVKVARAAARKAQKPLKKASRQAAGIRSKAGKRAGKAVKKASKAVNKAVKKAGKKANKAVKTAGKAVKTAGKAVKRAVVTAKALKAGVQAAFTPPKKANLDRPRKTVADIHGIPSSLGMAGLASAAHSGREELRDTLRKNTSASPRLTAGDVDADWQSAEAIGDEAPGGDNPTPDQDVVDEIGRALGVEYADDEELQGGAEITERDTHRWELDPSSKDDFDEED